MFVACLRRISDAVIVNEKNTEENESESAHVDDFVESDALVAPAIRPDDEAAPA